MSTTDKKITAAIDGWQQSLATAGVSLTTIAEDVRTAELPGTGEAYARIVSAAGDIASAIRTIDTIKENAHG